MKGAVIDEAALVMDGRDNVATALEDLEAGREFEVEGETVELVDDVPFGHKFAFEAIGRGEEVYKYGNVIGEASAEIAPGEWVHTHNCDSTRGRGDVGVDRARGGEEA
jgi:altronate dehydratase small subunit